MIKIQIIYDLLTIAEFPETESDSYYLRDTLNIQERVRVRTNALRVSEALTLVENARQTLLILGVLEDFVLYEQVSRPIDTYIEEHFDFDDIGRTVLQQIIEELLIFIDEVTDSKGFTETIGLEDNATFTMIRNLEVEEELGYSEGTIAYILDRHFNSCED